MSTAVTDALAESFVIEGARSLNGTIRAAGNKNGALPILAGCMLSPEPVVLRNVPRIRDVETMVELIADLGADAEWIGPNEVRIHAAELTKTELDELLCSRIRASVLLAGPLLARCGRAIVPPPGGDVIGRRRLDTHIHALARLGADIEANRRYTMRTDGLRGAHVFLDEASVTGTENAIMAAVLARGETVIGNAACEPHVQDLCRFLVTLGARIEGIGSNVLRIEGRTELTGGEYRIGCDHIEVASFIGLGAITSGEIVIEEVEPADLVAVMPTFDRLGIRMQVEGRTVRVPDGQELEIRDDLGGQIPKIEDGPWPAFPADLTSIAVVVATQARGTVLVFEKMFESRLFFVDKLVNMGARIILCDPHRVVVTGPARLYGERLTSPDIRAGMAMLLASLCAEGSSTIGNIGEIDRGYERIDERLRGLGAHVERVEA
ncbi:MAG TPA: UDP-N-acetylglucosamine 1-carboxyvinyltransferase [Gaiellaceae bacterium]|jgi:UDP-N-acetylglucosamine 1-carboxyvinyltransferase|nr:UDP-N-acetylglucosamine 1-carboxyvinyltransferase [Gaiellaceae bacterium]